MSGSIALALEHGNEFNQLMRKADLAMYHVKKVFNNTWYQIYDESIHQVLKRK